MKKVYIYACVFLLASSAQAQTARRNLAERYFGLLDYTAASPIYNELARKTVKKSGKGKPADWEVVRKAAQSEFYTRDYSKATAWYQSLVNGKAAVADDYSMYFEALRYQGKYDEAAAVLREMKAQGHELGTLKEYERNLNYPVYLTRDSTRYTVKEMPFNKGLGDFSAAYYQDGLIFVSTRKSQALMSKYGWDNTGYLNVYYARPKNGEYRKKAKLQKKELKTREHDGPVFFSKDSKQAFITRNRTEKDVRKGTIVNLSLYIAEKGDDGKWSVPQPFAYNSAVYSVGHAALSPDEKTLYFVSDMPGGQGGTDLWMCRREGNGWSAPQNLGKTLNTEKDEMFPFVADDGTLYYASNGLAGLGGLDLFESRAGSNGFMAPLNMGYPLNTKADDFALITRDHKTGYFSSDRRGYTDRVMSVEMRRVVLEVEGTVTDKDDPAKKLGNVQVVLRNRTLGDSTVVYTDSLGNFTFPLLKDCDYEIAGTKENFDLVSPATLSTQGKNTSEVLRADLRMEDNTLPKERAYRMLFVVKDCSTGNPVPNAEMSVKEEGGNEKKFYTSNAAGEIEILKTEPVVQGEALQPKQWKYIVENTGAGFFPETKKMAFEFGNTEPGAEKRREFVLNRDVCFNPIKENAVFELKDIYYDYNKATLRPQSMVELDKVYDFLKRNPQIKVQLSSHTDSRGSDSYNLSLSQRRAQSCVDYLIKVKGISEESLVAKGYGETMLANKCANGVKCTDEEHQANRRTEIRILKVQ